MFCVNVSLLLLSNVARRIVTYNLTYPSIFFLRKKSFGKVDNTKQLRSIVKSKQHFGIQRFFRL